LAMVYSRTSPDVPPFCMALHVVLQRERQKCGVIELR
jgi:hypothetical protein